MKKLVLAMVALLAIFTFIREYSGSRPDSLVGVTKALADPALADPALAASSLADPLVKIDR